MQAFLQGILLGLGVSVPIGPINVLIMSYALKSYSKALCLGLGAMSADAFFLLLSAFGVAKLLNSPSIFKVLAVFGACFLLYMAWQIFKSAKNEIKTKEANIDKIGSHSAIYLKGLLLNLLNPYVIMFWLSVSTTTAKIGGSFGVVLAGLVLGIFSWISLFPLVIYKNRKFVSPAVAMWLAYISALILLFFAFSLIYKTFFTLS